MKFNYKPIVITSFIFITLLLNSYSVISQISGGPITGLNFYNINLKFGYSSVDFKNADQKFANSELLRLYKSTENGPYLDNKWFEATLLSIDSAVFNTEGVKFRFDSYQQKLHFKVEGKSPQVLDNFIIGFTVKGENRVFTQISYKGDKVFVEKIVDDKHSLLRYYSTKIVNEKVVGPGANGVTTPKFKSSISYLYSYSDNKYTELKSGSIKKLLKSFPKLKEKYNVFKRETNSTLTKTDMLILFINWLNSNP